MDKISLLRDKMKQNGFDAVIVSEEINQRYLSEFHFSDGYILIFSDAAYLITDFRYYEAAIKNVSSTFEVIIPESPILFIEEQLKKHDVRVLGFEGASVSYQKYIYFSDRFSFLELKSIGNLISEMRAIKSSEEIEKMKKAQQITDFAFESVLKRLTTKMTEREVAIELDYAMRKSGAEDLAFDTIAVSGDASAIPHGTARNIQLKHGFLTMDFGAKFDGYCADMTRTVVVGKADNEMRKLYDTVLRAQTAALEYLREGADAGNADKTARDIIDSVPEYVGSFGHSLGHSIGLEVHEAPGLSRRNFGYKLKSGIVTSVEPGIYLPGKYGCRIEDMVLILGDGIFNFTSSTKELIEIY